MRKVKAVVYTSRALKVYFALYPYTYMPEQTAVLCTHHRDQLYERNPSAYGKGEYFPADQCEVCQKQKEVVS